MRGRRAAALMTVTALMIVPVVAVPPTPTAAQPGACARLTPSQLVAQVLGAPLREPAVGSSTATAVAQHVGTVVLLGPAIESAAQVSGLIADLDSWAPPGVAPLIAVDEEGGRVARFGAAGVTVHLPSARDQAAAGDADRVRAQAAELGAQMAALGVDYDLAPVLDLSDDAATTIIGDRSFSADPVIAGDHGAAFALGMRQAGLVTAAKHFPDHGLTTVDTHTDVAVVDVGIDALRAVHLEPYRRALPVIDSIMLSHLRVTALDGERPASLSPAVVDFLRTELTGPSGRPYDGVVVTDDLSMQAVAAVADQPTAALMALQAGADLALIGSVETAAAVHDRLLRAVTDGELSHHRLRGAVQRVLTLKGLTPDEVRCLVGPTHYARPRPVGQAMGR